MYQAPENLTRRISSAVRGTASAVAVMITWALPWAKTSPDIEGDDPEYYTFWHLMERGYNALATPVRILFILMLMTVLVLLGAACKATSAAYLVAGITTALTSTDEIYVWTKIGPDIGQTATGVAAATVLTLVTGTIYTFVGFYWLRLERQRSAHRQARRSTGSDRAGRP